MKKDKSLGEYAWAAVGAATYQVFESISTTWSILNSSAEIISTLDIRELMNILEKELPRYGIHTCCVALYENPPPFGYPQKIPEWSRLFLAIENGKRINLPPEGVRFPSRQLVPPGILKQNNRFRMVIEALYFREEQIGFWLLDIGARYEKVYPILSKQVNSSLQGALLLKKYLERTHELAAANKEIQVLNRQLKAENHRIGTEMDVARHIQIALLPENIETIHPDFEITARMLTAAEVGGDYYDISKDLEGNLWLAIGDVSGHGVPSGLIMMMAQTIHTTITTRLNESPRDIVGTINKVLMKNIYGRMGQSHYMTFTTLKYQGKGRFQYAGCHIDILIYRYREQRCELIETEGMWLNVLPDIMEQTKNKELFLDVGDVLVLFTDGITEVFNKDLVILDIHRFIDIVTTHGEKDVQTMKLSLLSDVLSWCYDEPKDDMTLVLCRRIR